MPDQRHEPAPDQRHDHDHGRKDQARKDQAPQGAGTDHRAGTDHHDAPDDGGAPDDSPPHDGAPDAPTVTFTVPEGATLVLTFDDHGLTGVVHTDPVFFG
jgi:hypothetical protein